MHITPTIDIIVPIWNNPFETRASLAAILAYSPGARLIIVDNGSNRETSRMLEEFSESLGDTGLFISSDRNVGLVPAINMGLSRSDSDFAVIIRPHVTVTAGWLSGLLSMANEPDMGIISPLLTGNSTIPLPPFNRDLTRMETGAVSFAGLMLKGEMQMLLGGFDEHLDGGEWCLKDYVRRAWSRGYRTGITSQAIMVCGNEEVFGSAERRAELARQSRDHYREQWGIERCYGIYFGAVDAPSLTSHMDILLEGARQGHSFTLFLHRKQYRDFKRLGWNALHTNISLQPLSLMFGNRDLAKKCTAFQTTNPDCLIVTSPEQAHLTGLTTSLSFDQMAEVITGSHNRVSAKDLPVEPAPVS